MQQKDSNEKREREVDSKVWGIKIMIVGLNHCQWYMGQLPLELKIVLEMIKFYTDLKNSDNFILRIVSIHDDVIN